MRQLGLYANFSSYEDLLKTISRSSTSPYPTSIRSLKLALRADNLIQFAFVATNVTHSENSKSTTSHHVYATASLTQSSSSTIFTIAAFPRRSLCSTIVHWRDNLAHKHSQETFNSLQLEDTNNLVQTVPLFTKDGDAYFQDYRSSAWTHSRSARRALQMKCTSRVYTSYYGTRSEHHPKPCTGQFTKPAQSLYYKSTIFTSIHISVLARELLWALPAKLSSNSYS